MHRFGITTLQFSFQLIFFSAILFCTSCSPSIQKTLTKEFTTSEAKFQDHKGFVLYDVQENKTVFEHKSASYFTPASNTKILTLFACLTILGDSIPSIKYAETNDSLIFWGLGDPSFLNKNVFTNYGIFKFLQASKKPLYFSSTNFNTDRFGTGWAWDDYNGSYQAERSSFPIYSNTLTGSIINQTLTIEPTRFSSQVSIGASQEQSDLVRDIHSNKLIFYPSYLPTNDEFEVPFLVSDTLIIKLLEDTLKCSVVPVNTKLSRNAKTLYSVPVDSMYKVMMQESDNFLAEQLLLQCAATISDSLKPEIAIRFMQENKLVDLPGKIIWVDGSGLSRYNLFTPRSMATVWKKLYEIVPQERLFSLLATGGENGTIKNWYKADAPYIFGKTGTLANNHCLSGYLITKSGKTLIFSFMNSNYLASTTDIRKNMQRVLEYIRYNYK